MVRVSLKNTFLSFDEVDSDEEGIAAAATGLPARDERRHASPRQAASPRSRSMDCPSPTRDRLDSDVDLAVDQQIQNLNRLITPAASPGNGSGAASGRVSGRSSPHSRHLPPVGTLPTLPNIEGMRGASPSSGSDGPVGAAAAAAPSTQELWQLRQRLQEMCRLKVGGSGSDDGMHRVFSNGSVSSMALSQEVNDDEDGCVEFDINIEEEPGTGHPGPIPTRMPEQRAEAGKVEGSALSPALDAVTPPLVQPHRRDSDPTSMPAPSLASAARPFVLPHRRGSDPAAALAPTHDAVARPFVPPHRRGSDPVCDKGDIPSSMQRPARPLVAGALAPAPTAPPGSFNRRTDPGQASPHQNGPPASLATGKNQSGRPQPNEYRHGHVPRTMNLKGEFAAQQQQNEETGTRAAFTTLMIRNIPNRYSQRELIMELEDLGFAGAFDFLYVPLDKGTMLNVGYAFVNFVDTARAEQCIRIFRNYRFKRHRKLSSKIASVSVAHIQGLEANLAHYEKAAVSASKFKQQRPVLMASISSALTGLGSDCDSDAA